jgi:hypothetical protein
MPNGLDRNWIRLCGAIDGFRARYRLWPTRIRLSEGILNNIKALFTFSSFAKIEEKITFIAIKDTTIIAEDDNGRRYNYCTEGFTQIPPDLTAKEWFGVNPDSKVGRRNC